MIIPSSSLTKLEGTPLFILSIVLTVNLTNFFLKRGSSHDIPFSVQPVVSENINLHPNCLIFSNFNGLSSPNLHSL